MSFRSTEGGRSYGVIGRANIRTRRRRVRGREGVIELWVMAITGVLVYWWCLVSCGVLH